MTLTVIPSLESLEQRLLLSDTTPPTIVDVLPLPAEGGSVTAAIDALTLTVSEDLQPAGVNSPASWELRGAGADTLFDTTDDVIYGLSADPAYASGTEVRLALSPMPLQEDSYRFTAFASALADIEGNPLDGDGNGVGGDDYVRTFTVTTPAGTVIESTYNDVIAYATPLDMLEDPAASGNFQGLGLGTVNPVSGGGPWTDPDFWRFDALAGDRVAVTLADRRAARPGDCYYVRVTQADGHMAWASPIFIT